MPAEEGPPQYEVLAALVASLRRELADALAVVEETRAELGRGADRWTSTARVRRLGRPGMTGHRLR